MVVEAITRSGSVVGPDAMKVPERLALVFRSVTTPPSDVTNRKEITGASFTWNVPLEPVPPSSATFTIFSPRILVSPGTSCTATTEASAPGASAWQVAHWASALCTGCVARTQEPEAKSQVTPVPNEAQSGSVVQAPAVGVPTTRTGLRVPVSKKRLSWQVPQARREKRVFHRSSAWHLLQFFSAPGSGGKATLR